MQHPKSQIRVSTQRNGAQSFVGRDVKTNNNSQNS